LAVTTHNDKNLAKRYLLNEIEGLEKLKRRSGNMEIRPVIDIYLGLAYVDKTMAEEQVKNKELATTDMNSAQTLFRSLGWRDYSEENLKMVARRELDRWNVQSQTTQEGK
jgi:hypothetical protein